LIDQLQLRNFSLLLLGSILLFIGLLLGLGHAELVEALVSARFPQRLVGGERGLILGDGARSFGLGHFGDRNDRLGHQLSGNVHLLLGSITLMGLGEFLGEEDQFGSVLLQSLDVLLQRFDAFVAATVIDRDPDGPGKVLVEPGGLNLFQSEATAETLLLVVLDGRASDDGPELSGGSGRYFSRQRLSGVLPADLPGWLIEPSLDAILPILLEMRVLDDVVVLGSHFLFSFTRW